MSTIRAHPLPAASEARPAGLLIRLAAMTYEGMLLFGVVFVAAYALLSLARWTYPLSAPQRLTMQIVLFLVLGLYFVHQWSRTGQTLAMKSWHLRLVGENGQPPSRGAATVRYLLAWHFVLPGALWVAFFGGRGVVDALVTLLGFFMLLLPARFDERRRLLHDRFSSTRVIRER